ncbi:MAG: bifunctional DNA-formamidopyrimidine glycosylase/DNA-(apurinic or apyrimidinic site) lyase [Acidobacteriota bacterium]
MPELPEVETIRQYLALHLAGRVVEKVVAEKVRLRTDLVPEDWSQVAGATFSRVERRGKYLLAHAGATVAVFHLGMSGRVVFLAAGAEVAPHTHLRLFLAGNLELRFVDPRRFGMASVLDAGELATFEPLAGLGPDPIHEEITPALLAAARRSRRAIRDLLLDQSVISGVGNIYASEALYRARVHPLRRASKISRQRIASLAAAVREVLLDAIAAGGTTLADGGFASANGELGTFAVQLAVYGRAGLPCTVCGQAISRRAVGGRSLFYCPRCQR